MTNQIIISDPILGSLEATEYMLGVWVCVYFDPNEECYGQGKSLGHNKKVAKFWAEAWDTLLSQAKDLGVVMFFCAPTSASREKAYLRRGWVKDPVYCLVYHVYSKEKSEEHIESIEIPFSELLEDEYLFWDEDNEALEVDLEYLTLSQEAAAKEAGFAEAWPVPIEDRIRMSARSLGLQNCLVNEAPFDCGWYVSIRVENRYENMFNIYREDVCALRAHYQEAARRMAALY